MYWVQVWIARNPDGWEKPEIEVECRKAARTAWTALASALHPTVEPPSELAIFIFIPIPSLVGSQSRFLAGAKCFSLESGRHSFVRATTAYNCRRCAMRPPTNPGRGPAA